MFFNKPESYFLHRIKEQKNGWEKTLKTFRFCAISVIAQNAIMKAPSSKIYFMSLIPDDYRGWLVYRLPVVLIQCEIWMNTFSSMRSSVCAVPKRCCYGIHAARGLRKFEEIICTNHVIEPSLKGQIG